MIPKADLASKEHQIYLKVRNLYELLWDLFCTIPFDIHMYGESWTSLRFDQFLASDSASQNRTPLPGPEHIRMALLCASWSVSNSTCAVGPGRIWGLSPRLIWKLPQLNLINFELYPLMIVGKMLAYWNASTTWSIPNIAGLFQFYLKGIKLINTPESQKEQWMNLGGFQQNGLKPCIHFTMTIVALPLSCTTYRYISCSFGTNDRCHILYMCWTT